MNKPVKTIFAIIFAITLNIGFIGSAHAASANVLINLANSSRAQNGLNNLTVNEKLTSAALAKAQDMFTNQYFAHTSPASKTPWDFIKAAGYDYATAGENLAIGYTNDQELHDAWMASSTHRANIMNENFREIGMAVVSGEYDGSATIIVVQEFGTVAPVTAVAETTEPIETPQVQSAQIDSGQFKQFNLIKDKTIFAPTKIFAGEKVKFTVVLTGEVDTIFITVGEQKIDLQDAQSIQQNGDEKTYQTEANIEKDGGFSVVLNVTDEAGHSEEMDLGRLNIAQKVITKENPSVANTFNQSFQGFVGQNMAILAWTVLFLTLGLAGFVVYRWQKHGRLA